MSSQRKLVILLLTLLSIFIGVFALLAYNNYIPFIQGKQEPWEIGVNKECNEIAVNKKIIELNDSKYYNLSYISGLSYTDNVSYIKSKDKNTSVTIIKGVSEDKILKKTKIKKNVSVSKELVYYTDKSVKLKKLVKNIGGDNWLYVITMDDSIYDKTVKLFKSKPKKYNYKPFDYSKVKGVNLSKLKADLSNVVDIKVGELKFRSEQTVDGYLTFGYRIMLYDEAVSYVNTRGQLLTGIDRPSRMSIVGNLQYYQYGDYYYLVNKIDMNNQFIIEGYGKTAKGSIVNYIHSLGV